MTIHATGPSSASQNATWTSGDQHATASVYRTSERDSRGATGWSYYLSAGAPGGVGFGHTFASPGDLIYGFEDGPLAVLRTLSSFLGAWDEAHRYGTPDSENRDIFPKSCEGFLPYVEEFTAVTSR